jgi:hypothetical protein
MVRIAKGVGAIKLIIRLPVIVTQYAFEPWQHPIASNASTPLNPIVRYQLNLG